MKNIGYLFIACLLILTINIQAQACFEVLEDNSGINQNEHYAELEAAACALVESLPVAYQDSFKVFDFGFYRHQEHFEGGFDPVFEQAKTLARRKSPYYLLFGKESNTKGIYDKFWVDLHLPGTTLSLCLTDNQKDILVNSIKNKVDNTHDANDKIPFQYYKAEIEGINKLKNELGKLLYCCPLTNARSNGCDLTISFEDAEAYLKGKKMLNYHHASNIKIQDNAVYSNISSWTEKQYSVEITSEGRTWALTDELENFIGDLPSNGYLGSAKVYYFNEDNLDEFNEYKYDAEINAIASNARMSNKFHEEIVILDFGDRPKVYYQFGFSENGVSARSVVLPAVVVYWVVKKAAMATVGVLAYVGIEVILEKVFGEHETWSAAWEASNLTGWGFLTAAVAGATADKIVYQGFTGLILKMTQYIFEHSGDSFSFETLMTEGIKGFAEGTGGVIAGKIIGKAISKIKKYLPNANIPDLSFAEVNKLFWNFFNNPRLFSAWKILVTNKVLRGNIDNLNAVLKYLDEIGDSISDVKRRFDGLKTDFEKKDWLKYLNFKFLVNSKSLNHIQKGQIKIRKINSNNKNDFVEYDYIPGNGGINPQSGFNYKVKSAGGLHQEKFIDGTFIRQIIGTKKKDIGSLPSGETIYTIEIEFFIKELSRNTNSYKKKSLPSTLFPDSWSSQKIKEVIEEASRRILEINGRRAIGMTKDGIKIEFWRDLGTDLIETAYIVF